MSSADIHTMHLTKLLNIKEISLKNRELEFGIQNVLQKKKKTQGKKRPSHYELKNYPY